MGGALGAVGRQLGRLFESGTVAGLTEGQLLDRFVRTRDEAAFEAIVARHGPMVIGVCRRFLRDPSDVDDAFQATFLVLVRKAGSLRRHDLLGNWLYGVASKVAARSRQTSARRGESLSDGIDPEAVARDDPARDVRDAVHEEVLRLPESYRTAVVLCYFEGLTHEEAAERLRWPVGTVKGRLSRARDLLRSRLTRRGATLGTVAAVDLLSADASAALPPIPPSLVDATTRAATFAADPSKAIGLGLASARAAALSEGVLHAMSLAKLKGLLASAAVGGAVLTSAGVFAQLPKGDGQAANVSKPAPEASNPSPVTINSSTDLVLMQQNLQEKVFRQTLAQPQAWDARLVDRLFHWSRAMKDAEEYMDQVYPGKGPLVAARGHRDRMKALHELTQTLTVPDQAKVADAARASLEAAERDLNSKAGTSQPHVQIKTADGTALTADQLVMDATKIPGANLSGDVTATKPAPKAEAPQAKVVVARDPGGNPVLPQNSRFWSPQSAIAAMGANVERFDQSPKTRAVLTKLDQSVALHFGKPTPIEDVLKYIKAATQGPNDAGIPVYVDPTALQDHIDEAVAVRKQSEQNQPGGGGMAPNEDEERKRYLSLSADLEGVPLKTSLRLMLKQVGLAYCVKDGLLIITSPRGILEELAEFESENVPADQRTLLPNMGGMGGGMGGMGGGMGGMGGGMGGMGGGMGGMGGMGQGMK